LRVEIYQHPVVGCVRYIDVASGVHRYLARVI
jgi:hypothetical protein